ncbi:TrbC/VirB2 family protein [Erwinia papayae]|uniref:TrbC/VirB2 family protein n=1 Tax=Erwinia papayae TaxID=206499 RepID=A0ABV3N7L3_9GAMM
MRSFLDKYGPAIFMGIVFFVIPELAMAAGTDTGESSANNFNAWLKTWIPIAFAVAILASAVAWGFHLLPASWMFRIFIACMVGGSASYLVSLTGLGS